MPIDLGPILAVAVIVLAPLLAKERPKPWLRKG